ncbi:MAG: hypothetical protein LWX83_01205 [Anaerolineae bacterium]|nr:hypothetical protein [Anaerolineae bacterium]
MKKISRLLFLTLMVSLLLSATACSGLFSTPTPTPSPMPPTDTPTPAPTKTPIPTNTPTPTITPSPTITLTPTANAGADFSKAKVILHGKVEGNWYYFITLELPEEPKGEFYALVNQNKEYTCTVSTKLPKRITCSGPMAAFDDDFDFDLYLKDYPTALYHTSIYIPAE